jgi:hypothetical protein
MRSGYLRVIQGTALSMWCIMGESSRCGVECGVLQGSVLGPQIFLLHVNDLVRVSGELGFVLFAENTNLYVEKPDLAGLF